MTTFKQIALKAAKLAGDRLMRSYASLKDTDIEKKGAHDLVTSADFEANNAIISTIKHEYPDHDFYSEETGLEKNPESYMWVIDPLDGTLNYTLKIPLFCTAIALVRRRELLLSIIYAPMLDELYYAERGAGAYLNDRRIKVSGNTRLIDAVITLSRSHHRDSHVRSAQVAQKLSRTAMNTRRLGSGSLDLAYVAVGRTDGVVIPPPDVSEWDVAPGALLVREAGGVVSDYGGKPWSLDSESAIATNGLIHEQLIKAIA
ncbi:MAG: inositol monophosphatase family protein [Patescibacteria group bacterium]